MRNDENTFPRAIRSFLSRSTTACIVAARRHRSLTVRLSCHLCPERLGMNTCPQFSPVQGQNKTADKKNVGVSARVEGTREQGKLSLLQLSNMRTGESITLFLADWSSSPLSCHSIERCILWRSVCYQDALMQRT